MTRHKAEGGGLKTAVLARLRRSICASVPLRSIWQTYLLFFSRWLSVLGLPLSAHAAEGVRPAYIQPPPAVSSGNIMQTIFSLLLVLAAIGLVAWLFKRVNVAQRGSVNLLKVVGSVAIGQRERAVLLEAGDTWLVIGVGPGQIRTLHTLPMPDSMVQSKAASGVQSAALPANASPANFSALLSSALGALSSRTSRTSGKHDAR